jgi:hypothetical protein
MLTVAVSIAYADGKLGYADVVLGQRQPPPCPMSTANGHQFLTVSTFTVSYSGVIIVVSSCFYSLHFKNSLKHQRMHTVQPGDVKTIFPEV